MSSINASGPHDWQLDHCTCTCHDCICLCHLKTDDWFVRECTVTTCIKSPTPQQVHCTLCHSNLTPSRKNPANRLMAKHVNSSSHIKLALNRGFTRSSRPEGSLTQKDRSAIAQGAIAYHTDFHAISSQSMDCTSALTRELFDPLFRCGADKQRFIVNEVFAPFAEDLLQRELDQAKFVSIYSDCTNHDIIKLHGINCRFYIPGHGLKHRLLDLDRLPDETANILASSILKAAKQFNIESKIIAISCDGAAVNFGGDYRTDRNSDFDKDQNNLHKHLQRELDCLLVGTECACHMANNAIQSAVEKLDIFNLNSVFRQLFDHFRGSTSRFQEMAMIEARADGVELIAKILTKIRPKSHSKTRWLSTKPATDRIISNFVNYRKYFNSAHLTGTKDVDTLRQFFNDKKSLPWLMIIGDMAALFHQTVKSMESEDITLPRVITKFDTLKESISKLALTHSPLPDDVAEKMQDWSEDEMTKFKDDAMHLYQNCYNYLGECSMAWMAGLKDLNWIDLRAPLVIDSVRESLEFLIKFDVFTRFGIDIEGEQLEEEIFKVNTIVDAKLEKWEHPDTDASSVVPTDQRWDEVFCQLQGQLPLMESIAAYIISLPPTNALAERLFSMVNNYWTKSRSSLHFQTVRCHFKVRFNIAPSCLDMVEHLRTNAELRNAINTRAKYTRRFKATQFSTFDLLMPKRICDKLTPPAAKKKKLNPKEELRELLNTINTTTDKYRKLSSEEEDLLQKCPTPAQRYSFRDTPLFIPQKDTAPPSKPRGKQWLPALLASEAISKCKHDYIETKLTKKAKKMKIKLETTVKSAPLSPQKILDSTQLEVSVILDHPHDHCFISSL